jgi:flavin reductase (DIM6/NTAB) family NADH-FMN oxidoreductase RutF
MLHIDPLQIPTAKLHGYLLASVAPRPICFASTIDKAGNVNLAPYSFFNVFSAKPPIVVFSPARRVRDNTTKHTLENVIETGEVVVNIVSYDMVQQMSLASTEYPKGVNEFTKAGFTPVASQTIAPPRVQEAPVQLECRVNDIISLGEEGGAGNLVICQVLRLHIDENILDDQGVIDPYKIDTVARLGANWYSRARTGLFEVEKPLRTLGVGVDALPEAIRLSKVLTGNDLGQLANVEELPAGVDATTSPSVEIQEKAKQLLQQGQVTAAWNLLASKS